MFRCVIECFAPYPRAMIFISDLLVIMQRIDSLFGRAEKDVLMLPVFHRVCSSIRMRAFVVRVKLFIN
jgi:hypothetical protein